MAGTSRLRSPVEFSRILFERIGSINPAAQKLALYEFCYAVEGLYPEDGWDSVQLDPHIKIEETICQRKFYDDIQTKPREKDRIVLDASITRLTRMLFVGLVRGEDSLEWVGRVF